MNDQIKSHYSDEIVAAWREQLAEAAENPWLAELLLKVGERILRRFTYFYEQLRALSRRARRYIQRKLALKLSAAAFLLALSGMHVPVAYANSINVADGVVADTDAQCSLIEAIENANDTTTGQPNADCAAGNPAGADTINLPTGSTFTLDSVNNTWEGYNGLPVITSKITIEGNGSTIERGGGAPPDFRILAVDGYNYNNGDLTLNDTTITGGNNVSGGGGGGGVYNYYGKVAINNSTISGNTVNGISQSGGGVYNFLARSPSKIAPSPAIPSTAAAATAAACLTTVVRSPSTTAPSPTMTPTTTAAVWLTTRTAARAWSPSTTAPSPAIPPAATAAACGTTRRTAQPR